MKSYLRILFIGALSGILNMHCTKESSVTYNNHLGEPFLMQPNDVKSLGPVLVPDHSPDSILSIRFVKLVNDGRCAKAACYLCYGSQATIQVTLTHQMKTVTFNLNISGCGDEYGCGESTFNRMDTLGYRICLLRLDPYPEGLITVNSADYTAKLEISKL